MFKLPFSIYADDIKWISYLILRLMEPLNYSESEPLFNPSLIHLKDRYKQLEPI